MPKYRPLDYSYLHVFNKSIANYNIFSGNSAKDRFLQTLTYYNQTTSSLRLSKYLEKNTVSTGDILIPRKNLKLKIIAYCIMPDHYHLLLKLGELVRLSNYIRIVEDSYSRYFNVKNNRKGPLWQSRFKHVVIENNSQLLHVTRYIHLNPTTSNLVEKPGEWTYSSYNAYIQNPMILKRYLKEISINSPDRYKLFSENQIDYQKKLKLIKKLTF